MFYDCNTFKPISESPHRIQELEEARGELIRIFEAEGQCMACFSWGAVSLPGELLEELQALVSKTVCILRLDGRYHVRAVE
jgi:hypothetical protein